MQKITPFLWFDDQAEHAADFYTSIFKNSKIVTTTRYDDAGAKMSGKTAGSVMTVAFQLAGTDFTAINGGPMFKFNEAISFVINCEDQGEVDYFWNKLTEGGEEGQCGWLKDKFGVSWQVVPRQLSELLGDPQKAPRIMPLLLQMKKIDVDALRNAAN